MYLRSVALALMLSPLLALSQQPVPPPPKPADSGPSLEVTLKFIQDKLAQEGRVNFATFFHVDGQDDTSTERSILASIASYDLAKCRIFYTWETTYGNGGNKSGTDLALKGVTTIKVVSGEAWWNSELAEEGHALWSARVTPPIFLLALGQSTGHRTCYDAKMKTVACAPPTPLERMQMTWAFRNESDANRVAQALTHAIELCGGGNKDPF